MLPYDSYKQEHLVVLLFVVSDYLMFLCFAMLYKKFTQFSKLFKHWNKQIVYHFSCGKVSFNQIKVAIIGSGPAGFYTSQALLKVFSLIFY